MSIIEHAGPAPSCTLPILNPARAHIPAGDTDVRRTWKQYSVLDLVDDYGMVDAQDWLSAPGGFRS
jgi:hypothetical protein